MVYKTQNLPVSFVSQHLLGSESDTYLQAVLFHRDQLTLSPTSAVELSHPIDSFAVRVTAIIGLELASRHALSTESNTKS